MTAGDRGTPVVRPPLSGPWADAARRHSIRTVVVGALLVASGLLLTAATYAIASGDPQGGHYVVAFGPVIFGVVLLTRGLRGLHRLRPGRRPGQELGPRWESGRVDALGFDDGEDRGAR